MVRAPLGDPTLSANLGAYGTEKVPTFVPS